MSTKIEASLLREFAPKNIGDQVHVDHLGCPSGTDTKRRLYIKKVPGGILGYCHHCSGSGFVRLMTPEGRDLSEWLKSKPIDVPDVSTEDYKYAHHGLPYTGSRGDLWIHKYLTDDLIDMRYINGNGNPDQVQLTLFTIEHMFSIGKQVRNTVTCPKYITTYRPDINRGDAAWFMGKENLLFITEDYMSAYKIFKVTGVTTVALLKTTASDATIRQIQDFEPKEVVVWLDSDLAGVSGTTKLVKRLNYALPNYVAVNSVATPHDPKEQPVDYIQNLAKSFDYYRK